jgi:hypothetical protein
MKTAKAVSHYKSSSVSAAVIEKCHRILSGRPVYGKNRKHFKTIFAFPLYLFWPVISFVSLRCYYGVRFPGKF